MRGSNRPRPVVWLAAAVGALWGAAGYAILWGYTSVVATRGYVDSHAGLITLLPVRIVLEGIRVVEDHVAGHPFDFSRNHGWIGIAAAATGAVLLAVPTLAARTLVRRLAGRATPPGEPKEG